MTTRLALALLFIVAAALAYPYQDTTRQWVLGVSIAVVIALFAWWRGEFATTKLARRWAIWRGNHGGTRRSSSGDTATVVLAVEDPLDDELPVALIAGYADRYGLRLDKVRITSRETTGQSSHWISLTLDAAQNLPALQARSASIPVQETAETVGRRLADHLREGGWTVMAVQQAPRPVSETAKETWRALADESGHLTAYRIPVDALPATLAAVRAHPCEERWTAVEFGCDTVTAVAALRTAERPAGAPPVAGLATLGGRQRSTLDALDPFSAHRLPGHQPAGTLADQVRWPSVV
ncbi:type VII secretion protein EccE [Mycolicibacterium bacteremicum]|uniref:Type VII secretion protein EccE n=1 Tax=Mycolicibacterium bacteremicum TaxID=564198 RepID=A0A1W9Z1K9_MYCBA|nr:type VII secretion protein EccE [Mycolicibacterium bacteremicum]MCV7432341.1 type VII secretion protein EccE [Mycolicibacterium bacteremicum]ORA06062.1 type VII secretion protein EccE [Mycolicibacterium bacteremicum]